ncbi:histidinol dehydrogenase : Histidinol dehydrogenase OS=Singulisphaera acidiphila (strain ATCC BAA-1392 / DSM 18658 / VKM B-2454 / MOB10) GN=hisD PE=3 SV=1: Histidinol_dh [Gemmata massiliana]|uniref:Histidinol dehydrogenase n=1 Tax=Gemmata massiliana TaxID=1210884 RepID=A0A6P2CY84_9BACT|nr:histidinol dehydrogenase [Gemmata massiliana]VTR93961.1 histidinol dehydrogenase : Histidinol dehydrogenase OS=Singulisphaera acidiphila (strain ATCC BAA-1392 / DSM 18658 / VKM B-2454 / MOB10) GN=hisD PE=3 SV=1: Histidinol_dh [Gemmata massiliana]
MPALKLRRIDLTANNAAAQIAKLRDQFRTDTEVVSAASKKKTQAVFGEALPPARAVERICNDVREKGLAAALNYTELFDGIKLKPDQLRVKPAELAEAHANVGDDFLEVIRQIRYNVMQFQSGLLQRDAVMPVSGKHELQVRYRALNRVGVYCPGGAAAYPSTLLMTVCPAQVAGCEQIIVCMPPNATGAYNREMLATCHELGITEVYRLGGAQAIAAMAYGVEGLKPVDMIVGPGNQYVALAKKHVFGQVAIDCIAGPSEIVVLADDSAHPDYVALDLLAQAEHSPGVAVLVTWYEPLMNEIQDALAKRLAKLSRADLAKDSLERFGAIVLAPNKAAAVDCVNAIAPEHLHIQTRDPDAILDDIESAGAVFLGPFTPVAVGDYAAGPSHVLPTGGTARFASGLNTNDFRKRTSILRFTRNGLKDIASDVIFLANKEGLTAHAASVELRANDNGPAARPKPKPDKVPAVAPAKK